MEPRVSFITLGVSSLERATRFYRDVLGLPQKATPPTVAFFEMGKTWLALYPREALAADAGVPAAGSGFPGFALAHTSAIRWLALPVVTTAQLVVASRRVRQILLRYTSPR